MERNFTFFAFSTVFVLLVIYLYKKFKILKNLPPGPWGLPIVGSLIHLNKNNPLDEFAKYHEKYGDIFSVGLGNFNVVVFKGYKLIQETLKKDIFNGRPDFVGWKFANGGKKNRGILFCDANENWNEQRRFALKSLRDFGFGKESMEGLFVFELQELIKYIEKNMHNPMSIKHILNASVLNSLWSILTSKRFEIEDKEFLRVITMFTNLLQSTYLTSPAMFFPEFFQYFFRKAFNNNLEARVEVLNLVRKEIKINKETYKEGMMRDFVDLHLSEQQKTTSKTSSFGSEEKEINMVIVMKDLFIAGAETTSTTILWALLYLSQNPKVQVKAQKEIDIVLEKRMPSKSDKSKLVYIEAVLSEVHRKCSLLPLSVYHKVQEDTEFEGYFLPKGTVLLPNLYDCHHDKDYWKDPENFRPERFLDETETKIIKHSPLMPFSTGKRQCLGEVLARDNLFIILTGLLQKFNFKLAPDSIHLNNGIKMPTFIMSPEDFNLTITYRI